MLLTKKDYPKIKNALCEKQQGVCAICKRPFTEDLNTYHLDHDHALDGSNAGKVRGLLCTFCNQFEGQVKHKFERSGLKKHVDFIETLENLLYYLKQDYSENPLHPNYPVDKAKQFSRMSKDEMIDVMQQSGFEYDSTDTKENLVKKYKKQLRKSLKKG